MANHTKTITLTDEDQKLFSDSIYNDTDNKGIDAWIQDAVDGFIFAINNKNLEGNCYNLGYSEANLSKRELCQLIQKILPNFVYLISEIGEDIDKRNYIVSNDKIESTGWSPAYSIDDGIDELIKIYSFLRPNKFNNL